MKRILSFALLLALVFGNFAWVNAQEEGEPAIIKLDPIADINPVKTQHTMVATVLDKNGKPLSGQRVEWILARAPKGVGDIVEHDDMGSIVGSNKKITKLSNHYSVSYTNERPVVLTKGTATTSDDVKLEVGQTWLTITSPVEGETHIIAFCPAIKNANKHKVFAIKYWIDAKIDWPENAVNKVGTPHEFKFKLTKASSNTPLSGYLVKWSLVEREENPAYLGNNKDTKVVSTETDEEGVARVTLNQLKSVEGFNQVKIQLSKPTGELLAIRTVTKRWIAPKVEIVKTGPDEGIIGEKVVYNIRATNPGDADAKEVKVVDTIPEGMSYLEATPAPDNIDGNVLTWNVGILRKGGDRVFKLTLKADTTGTKKNVAVLYSKETSPKTGIAVTKIVAPDLYIIKEGPALTRRGNVANYKITVKNKGNGVARAVFIRDEIPAGMKFRTRDKGVVLRWRIGELQPGQSVTRTYSLDTIKVGTYDNIAKVYMKRKLVHKTTFRTKVIAPDIKIVKEGPSLVFLNKPANYTITITNDGNADAKNVILTDTLPKNLDYISSSPAGIFKPGKGEKLARIKWKLGDIGAGKKKIIKLSTRANKVGRCKNSVKMISDTDILPKIEPQTAICMTNIIGVPAMHINSYDTEDPVEVGKQTIYVIEVRNEGTSPCTNVVLIDTVDDEMEFISASGPVPYKAEGNKITFEPAPILQPGEKLTYRIVCKAVKEGSAKNNAQLKYDQFEKYIIDEEGTSVYK